MSADNWGGPAFACASENGHQPGMSLREWFAGQALGNSAICTGTAPEWQIAVWFKGRAGITREEIAARQAYEFSRAMLVEANKA